MEKLLVIAGLGQKLFSKRLFQRMLVCGGVLAALIIMIAIALSALLIGLLFMTHTALLHWGFSPATAMLVIAIITVVMIGALVMLAAYYVRQLPRLLAPQSPITERIGGVFSAFVDGFTKK